MEMAETWEMLLKREQDRSRSQTIALGDRIRGVLFHTEDRIEESEDQRIKMKAA